MLPLYIHCVYISITIQSDSKDICIVTKKLKFQIIAVSTEILSSVTDSTVIIRNGF